MLYFLLLAVAVVAVAAQPAAPTGTYCLAAYVSSDGSCTTRRSSTPYPYGVCDASVGSPTIVVTNQTTLVGYTCSTSGCAACQANVTACARLCAPTQVSNLPAAVVTEGACVGRGPLYADMRVTWPCASSSGDAKLVPLVPLLAFVYLGL